VAMFINKIGGMIELAKGSVHYDKEELATVFSLCNAFGRVFWGWVIDRFNRKGISPARVLMITCTSTALAEFILAAAPDQLMLMSVLLGLSFGGMFDCGE
jgi:MFS family permease